MRDEGCIHHVMRGKCIPRDVDRVAGELAARQYGVVGRRQLALFGIGRRAMEERLRRGVWHPVHAGVYAVGHSCLSDHGRLMAAVIACGPEAVLSHRSAGRHWGLLSHAPAIPEVTRPLRFRARDGIIARRSSLPVDEVTVVERIPVTSVSRTLLDLAVLLTMPQMERALNEAEVLRLTDKLSVPDLLERYPRRAGSAALRALFRDRTAIRGITRKELERRFHAALDGTDLPRPRRNAHLSVRGRFFEADCLWAEQRLIVELDGRESHGTDLAFEKDRERDRLLLVEGWRVARVTWRQLRDDAPAVIADLRELLRG
jgi:Protein of unknown function (DUF559)